MVVKQVDAGTSDVISVELFGYVFGVEPGSFCHVKHPFSLAGVRLGVFEAVL